MCHRADVRSLHPQSRLWLSALSRALLGSIVVAALVALSWTLIDHGWPSYSYSIGYSISFWLPPLIVGGVYGLVSGGTAAVVALLTYGVTIRFRAACCTYVIGVLLWSTGLFGVLGREWWLVAVALITASGVSVWSFAPLRQLPAAGYPNDH